MATMRGGGTLRVFRNINVARTKGEKLEMFLYGVYRIWGIESKIPGMSWTGTMAAGSYQ